MVARLAAEFADKETKSRFLQANSSVTGCSNNYGSC